MDAATDFLLKHWHVVGPLALLCLAFLAFYIGPAVVLDARLRRTCRSLGVLTADRTEEPRHLEIDDLSLKHLWSQYCATLHSEKSLDPVSAIETVTGFRTTVPAAAIFSSASVIDGRLHVEFFKHLPGLLTGLGIIGTFGGLIGGLGNANTKNGLDTAALISSVQEAFYVSAGAIVAAMAVTFVEKVLYARLHRLTETLCHQIDSLYYAGAGEEYLARLVHATEQSATHAAQLKDSLVGELRDILERLAAQQIEAAGR
jgi:hypothetical protein